MTTDEIARIRASVTENTLAGFREFVIADRPTVTEEKDGYALLLDMETRVPIGVRWQDPARIRAEALEEAARMVEQYLDELVYRSDIAAAIRDLIPKEPPAALINNPVDESPS